MIRINKQITTNKKCINSFLIIKDENMFLDGSIDTVIKNYSNIL